MISQTVDKILQAEKHASEQLEAAHDKAARILTEAGKSAEKLLEDAKSALNVETTGLQVANKQKVEAILQKSTSETEVLLSTVHSAVQLKKENAIATVIEKIIVG